MVRLAALLLNMLTGLSRKGPELSRTVTVQPAGTPLRGPALSAAC
jgi:hypothetical protein